MQGEAMTTPAKVTRCWEFKGDWYVKPEPNGLSFCLNTEEAAQHYLALEQAHAKVTAKLAQVQHNRVTEDAIMAGLRDKIDALMAERNALKAQVADLTERETILTEAWRKCGIERSQLSDVVTALVGALEKAAYPIEQYATIQGGSMWKELNETVKALLASPAVAVYQHKDAS